MSLPTSSTSPASTSTMLSGSTSSPSAGPSASARGLRSDKPMFLPLDEDSPLFIVKGILASGALGAITGASMGVINSQNPFALSTNMTINFTLIGSTFFCAREYLVSPALLSLGLTQDHTRRLQELEQAYDQRWGRPPLTDGPVIGARSLGEVRMNRVIDSGLAGGLAGGIISGAFRGPATIPKAAFTSSIIAAVLQLGVNQLRVTRLKALAKHSPSLYESPVSASGSTSTISNSNLTSSSSPHARLESHTKAVGSSLANGKVNEDKDDSTIFRSFEDNLKSSPSQDPSRPNAAPSLPERMMGSLSTFLPVRKLTNAEYLATLEKKRGEVDKRLKEIEDEERRMYDWASSQTKA